MSDPAAAAAAAVPPKNATTAIGYFWKAREMLTPTLKQTAFLSRGVLTPDEFVRAGDELVFRCPTWSWQGGDMTYLPHDKQYLITRHVPCQNRVATLELQLPTHQLASSTDGGGDDDDGDWMISSLLPAGGGGNNNNDLGTIEDDFDVLDQDGEVVPATTTKNDKTKKNADTAVEEEEEEYADMADFEDNNVLADDDAIVKAVEEEEDHTVKVRTYDLSITYDKYYQTPRIWMTGKSATGSPLTAKETMEDVMTDYANKTVTMEAHPFLPGPHASIHPCKHGKVMKAIVRNLINMSNTKEGAQEPTVEMYIFIFLKFVNSIIPTISYDFTMNVSASTAK
jgi:ubiquitin-like-conjugating enzyme ATG3